MELFSVDEKLRWRVTSNTPLPPPAPPEEFALEYDIYIFAWLVQPV